MRESSAEAVAAVSERSSPFGPLLRTLRIKAGLSQDGLAERAGISAKTIGALEQGARRAAHDDTIDRIATALRLPSTEREALLHAAQHSRARRTGRAADVPQQTLPVMLTSFIERRGVEDIAALLDTNRLVTITGTGGVGKTRTAIEVARRAAIRDHSLWFVDLSRVGSSDAILSELASVVGISLSDTQGVYAGVARRLDMHPSRLVLDNCEHVLDGLADLVPRLLQACPQLSILATSREPLALSFEAAYRLPSLDVPAGGIATLEEALEYSALRLFLDRIESGRAAWLRTPAALEKLGQLCRDLDGIPLAIELVASRVATLGLDMLRAELARGLTLSGTRDLPERHRTMSATIAWSYHLLDATERAVLRRLSIFAGSFRLDVAQRVCADGEVPAYAIVDACHRLAQKSLIVVDHGEAIRYRLLGAIRAFGKTLLSSEENATLQINHRHWLRELSDAVHDNRPGVSLVSLVLELDNVRAEIERCLERGGQDDILDAAAIAGGLRRLWSETNRNRELKHYVELLLARLDPQRHLHLISRLLLAACLYTPRPEKPALLARTIPVLMADGNRVAAAVMLSNLANCHVKAGDTQAANRSIRESFELLAGLDPASQRAYWICLMERAWISCLQGDIAQATADVRQLATYLGDRTDPDGLERGALAILAAEVAAARGDVSAAISMLDSLLEHAQGRPLHNSFQVRTNLASYHAAVGNTDAALELVRIVLAELPDTDWASEAEEYFFILIPAAAVAAARAKARMGAVMLGHCTEHWLKGRATLATQAPLRTKLLELLNAALPAHELQPLFDEGAAMLPGEFLEFVRADPLFAPHAHTNASAHLVNDYGLD